MSAFKPTAHRMHHMHPAGQLPRSLIGYIRFGQLISINNAATCSNNVTHHAYRVKKVLIHLATLCQDKRLVVEGSGQPVGKALCFMGANTMRIRPVFPADAAKP